MVVTLLVWCLALRLVLASCPMYCVCQKQSIDCSRRQLNSVPLDLPTQIIPHGSFGIPIIPDQSSPFINLNLAYNSIEELPISLLSERLPYLQKLDLSNNNINNLTDIESIVLSKELLYLSISSNPIKNLGINKETVLYSPSVSHLDVSDCAISSITNPATFMFMMNLTYLDLSGNPLVVIDHLISASLAHLDLSGCLLGDKGIREESFVELTQLQFLNVSMNAQLTHFPLLKTLSKTVTMLDASNCAFEKLDLRSFPNLTSVSLKGNVIKYLHDEMLLENRILQNLDLSENSVHRLDADAFKGAKSLKKLDLSLNYLSNVNWKVLAPCENLITLNFSRNLISSLEEIPIPSLVTLDASYCDIVRMSPRFLAKAYELRNLNLSHNYIEKIPRRLASRKLLNLDLSFCRLSDLHYETFEDLSSLVTLNLMGNRLTNPIKGSFLDQLVNLKYLNLQNNPWHCYCNDNDLRKLWKYPPSHPFKNEYFKSIICHSPIEFSGISLERNCFENLTKFAEQTQKHGAWFSVLVPLLTLCCLLAIMLVIRQAYNNHALEAQEREINDHRTNSVRHHTPRIPAHEFDEELEAGILMSVNESTQRSAVISELSKLPSYEEALLLPTPQSREDLKNIIQKYEERGRFSRSVVQDQETESSTLDNNILERQNPDHPSTSRQQYNIPNT